MLVKQSGTPPKELSILEMNICKLQCDQKKFAKYL